MKHLIRSTAVVLVLILSVGLTPAVIGASASPVVRSAPAGPPPKIPVASGLGYTVSVDLTGNVSLVFGRGVSNSMLWVLAGNGCGIRCVQVYLVGLADRFMPRHRTWCAPWWLGGWCKTFNVRSNFIHDVMTRPHGLYNAVVRADFVYGDCVGWQAWRSPRFFFHTNNDCGR